MSVRDATIIGNLGESPELRFFENDDGEERPYLSVSVATQTQFDDEAVWITLLAFGPQAEFLADYASKGDNVYATGRFSAEGYTNDGSVGAELTVKADDVQLLGGGNDNEDVEE